MKKISAILAGSLILGACGPGSPLSETGMSTVPATPVPSAAISPENSPTDTTQKKSFSLKMRGSAALESFGLQQGQKICLPELKRIDSEISLDAPLSDEAAQSFKALGLIVQPDKLIWQQEISNLEDFIQGFSITIPNLPGQNLDILMQLKNSVGNSMGSLSLTTPLDSPEKTVAVLFSPAKPGDSGSQCTALIPELTGNANLQSTAGGLMASIPTETTPPTPTETPADISRIKSLKIKTNSRFLTKDGESRLLEVELLDQNGNTLPTTEGVIQWSSSRPQDITIDSNGLITAQTGLGFSQVTARVVGTSLSDSILFDVSDDIFFTTPSSSSASAINQKLRTFPVTTYFHACGTLSENIEISTTAPDVTSSVLSQGSGGMLQSTLNLPSGNWTILAKTENGAVRGQTMIEVSKNGTVSFRGKGESLIQSVPLSGVSTPASSYTISTLAGTDDDDYIGLGFPLSKVKLEPVGTGIFDSSGNMYIVADRRILKVDAQSQIVSLFAGTNQNQNSGAGGPAVNASFRGVAALATDSNGNVYISPDDGNIYRVGSNGIYERFAGTGTAGDSGENGPANAAQISFPSGLVTDDDDNLYFTDVNNHKIKRIDGNTGIITTIAGTGTAGFAGDGAPATGAELNRPTRITIDKVNNLLYFYDSSNRRIRSIELDGSAHINTVAGTGANGPSGDGALAVNATLATSVGLAVEANGDLLTFNEQNQVRKIDFQTKNINTIAGGGNISPLAQPDILATEATISARGITVANGKIFLLVEDGIMLLENGTLSAYKNANAYNAIDGVATQSILDVPRDLVIDSKGNIYIADTENERIRKIDTQGVITTLVGNGRTRGPGRPELLGNGGQGIFAEVNHPKGITLGPKEEFLYFSDTGNNAIRRYDLKTGIVTHFAGDGTNGGGNSGDGGPATDAEFRAPTGIDFDDAGNLYIADRGNHQVRKIDTNGIITTVAGIGSSGFAGDGGPATAARLREPIDVFVESNQLYITSRGNDIVRKVDLETGIISTFAGVPSGGNFNGNNGLASAATFADPYHIAVDDCGNQAYLSLADSEVIARIDLTTNLLQVIAGTPENEGYAGDGGPALNALLDEPRGITLGKDGSVYFTSRKTNVIRKLAPQ